MCLSHVNVIFVWPPHDPCSQLLGKHAEIQIYLMDLYWSLKLRLKKEWFHINMKPGDYKQKEMFKNLWKLFIK